MRQVLTTDQLPPHVGSVASTAAEYDVHKYGAKGDGATHDTAAIQAAINAASSAGGGIVLVSTGKYAVARLELRSNVTVHLNQGAILLGSRARQGLRRRAARDCFCARRSISPSRARARSTAK